MWRCEAIVLCKKVTLAAARGFSPPAKIRGLCQNARKDITQLFTTTSTASALRPPQFSFHHILHPLRSALTPISHPVHRHVGSRPAHFHLESPHTGATPSPHSGGAGAPPWCLPRLSPRPPHQHPHVRHWRIPAHIWQPAAPQVTAPRLPLRAGPTRHTSPPVHSQPVMPLA